MLRPMVAGNWKMNLNLALARELLGQLKEGLPASCRCDVLICPPAYLLFPMAKAVAGGAIRLGAQNVHEAAEGAFTGEMSANMMKDAGCDFVLVGHSERRHVFGESPKRLHGKLRAVIAAGMTAMYCVGETLTQRDAGEMSAVIRGQLREAGLRELPPEKMIVAYEPVWAIGTGRTANPAQAQEAHAEIRSVLEADWGRVGREVQILYGGSVKSQNAGALAAQADVNGMLVGGASLAAEEFLGIISAVDEAAAK